MRALTVLMLIGCCNLSVQAHSLKMAVFKIYRSDTSIDIDINFDIENFSQAMNGGEVNLKMIQAYLDENTHFQFDHKATNLTVSDFDTTNDLIKIKGTFGSYPPSISHIKIENTCLNNISNHSNIIKLGLNNDSRDFRMHEGRTVILVEY